MGVVKSVFVLYVVVEEVRRIYFVYDMVDLFCTIVVAEGTRYLPTMERLFFEKKISIKSFDYILQLQEIWLFTHTCYVWKEAYYVFVLSLLHIK